MVGDGPLRGKMESILFADPCRPFVTFTGLVPQAQAALYIAASDVLLSPHIGNPDGTRFFGSPTKLFEYMAMSKAVVASDLEQIATVMVGALRVRSQSCIQSSAGAKPSGILCEAGNADELAVAVRVAVEQPELRRELGRNARLLALRHYTWDRHVTEILNALRHVDGQGAACSQ
jgi:glycosyltransferase involved in cell wall biosynthesis